MTLQDRKDMALKLRAQGCNCAFATIAPFAAELRLAPGTLRAVTLALGTGVAGTREICGVPNAIAIARGIINDANGRNKVEAMTDARKLIEDFAGRNGGQLRCCDLKGRPGVPSCNELILQGIEILHNS